MFCSPCIYKKLLSRVSRNNSCHQHIVTVITEFFRTPCTKRKSDVLPGLTRSRGTHQECLDWVQMELSQTLNSQWWRCEPFPVYNSMIFSVQGSSLESSPRRGASSSALFWASTNLISNLATHSVEWSLELSRLGNLFLNYILLNGNSSWKQTLTI